MILKYKNKRLKSISKHKSKKRTHAFATNCLDELKFDSN